MTKNNLFWACLNIIISMPLDIFLFSFLFVINCLCSENVGCEPENLSSALKN